MARHRTIFSALLIASAALCACGKAGPIEEPRKASMPAVCARAQFQDALDRFEAAADRRDALLLRAEKYPQGEPAEYLRRYEKDLAEYRELAREAAAIAVPRCLREAREIFIGYLDKSDAAMVARHPGEDPSAYRQRRETADTVYAQFRSEVAQQRKNAQ
jgi:hypothetical protein